MLVNRLLIRLAVTARQLPLKNITTRLTRKFTTVATLNPPVPAIHSTQGTLLTKGYSIVTSGTKMGTKLSTVISTITMIQTMAQTLTATKLPFLSRESPPRESTLALLPLSRKRKRGAASPSQLYYTQQ